MSNQRITTARIGIQLSLLTAAFALACAAMPAQAARETRSEKEAPPPEVAQPQTSALAAVDAALREKYAEYLGLSTSPEGVVLLTLSKGADYEGAANLAREAWLKASRRELREYLPQFDFVTAVASREELNKAYVEMRDVLTLKDVVYLDLDEANGNIKVGVAQDSAFEHVYYYVAKLRIDKNWVKVVMAPRYIETQTALTGRFRPSMGGVQIRTQGGICSLGLPTFSFTRGVAGFLTASHCTGGPMGAMQATEFFQSTGALADSVGFESLDLAMFDSTTDASCPVGRTCRRSDAAFVSYSQSTFGITGRIKRPTNMCAGTTPCALGVTRPTDDIRMYYGISGLFTGTNVNKVGRTSGWTSGNITNTCSDINIFALDAAGNVFDTMRTMLCQVQVASVSQPGDSGSPVFEFDPAVGAGSFAGILWGGALDGSSMVYSPIDNIQQELGSFVFNQAGVSSPFVTNGRFYTSNVADTLDVMVERNVVPSDVVEFAIMSTANISQRKEIVLVEGAAVGTGRWTIATEGNIHRDVNGLYLYQLPGGLLEFRKKIGNGMSEVTRIPIDRIPGGTRLTFTWMAD